ncbi:MAG TPA: nuclease, partial [Gemmatimonadota bacterium]
MHTTDAGLVFSATDLSHFLACPHLTRLDRAEALGLGPKRPVFDDPATEVLRKRGLEHEHAYRARLEAEGRDVVAIEHPERGAPTAQRWTTLAGATLDAMRGGADVLYQGCLFDGTWLGFPDFLVRVDQPSDLGPWSYDIVDTKLAREAKGGALLQLCSYADLLTQVQGVAPSRLHLVLGGPTPRTESFRLA